MQQSILSTPLYSRNPQAAAAHDHNYTTLG